jgi:cytochrome P450
VKLATTFGGAGVIHGDLTPECAEFVQTVLDALSAPAGADDDRPQEQRYHDALQEAIRLATPLQLVGRTAARDVTLHGVRIPAGGRMVLVYGTANRDERRFTDPDRFDVTRGRFRHLGFGEGMHGCLGAPLARLEAKVAPEEALPVLGDYTIAAPPERYRTTPNMCVWEHLHLSFRSAGGGPGPACRTWRRCRAGPPA